MNVKSIFAVIKGFYTEPFTAFRTKPKTLRELRALQISTLKWIVYGYAIGFLYSPFVFFLMFSGNERLLFILQIPMMILVMPAYLGTLIYAKALFWDFSRMVTCCHCKRVMAQLNGPLPVPERLKIVTCPYCNMPIMDIQ